METGVTVGGVHSIQYSIQISIQNSKSTVYHSMCMTPDQYITTNYFWARFSMKWYTNSFLLSSDYMLGDVYCTREQCCMHYDDVIMCAIASLITSLTIVYRLFRRRSKKTSKLRVTGLYVMNSPGTGEFPSQMASNAENISIWWRHHV